MPYAAPAQESVQGGRTDANMEKRFCFKASLALALLVCAPLASATTEESRSALRAVTERVTFKRLSNGLRVIMYKRGIAPVFAGVVSVRVGGTDEVVGQTGISHMFEHMAFKGTPDVGTRDFARESDLLAELERIAMESRGGNQLTPGQEARWKELNEELSKLWINGQFTLEYEKRGASGMNATTDKELTNYFVSFPRTAFEFWCWMESERILRPVMRQFYQERDVVMEERRMRSEDDPEGQLYEMLLGVTYLKHPYRNPVVGYSYDISSLTADRTDEFRKRYYVPTNIVIGIVGDVDPERDLPVIEQYFGRLPYAPAPPRPGIREEQQKGERQIVLEREVSPQLMMAYHKPQYPDPEDPAVSVMLEILAGSKISPMYTELVKRRQLVSSIGFDEGPGVAYPNLAMFFAPVKKPHSNEEVIAAFDEVLADFKRRGVTEEQLTIAKRAIAMDYLSGMRSNLALAADFAHSEIIYDDWRAIEKWYDAVMKVTSEDVKNVAEKYLVKVNRTVGRIEKKR